MAQKRADSVHAAASKQIRAELKRRGIKATVRSKGYTGGNSVSIDVLEDLEPEALRETEEFCGQYQQGNFDGMDDSYRYTNRRPDLPQVRYVFVSVSWSDKIIAEAQTYAGDRFWQALRGRVPGFWEQRAAA
jgi:hypothetical protein